MLRLFIIVEELYLSNGVLKFNNSQLVCNINGAWVG
jgi:hypothetical protein